MAYNANVYCEFPNFKTRKISGGSMKGTIETEGIRKQNLEKGRGATKLRSDEKMM